MKKNINNVEFGFLIYFLGVIVLAIKFLIDEIRKNKK